MPWRSRPVDARRTSRLPPGLPLHDPLVGSPHRGRYVRLALGDQGRRTGTAHSHSPQWDEAFEFEGQLDELLATPLMLACFDAAFAFSADELGSVTVRHGPRPHGQAHP